METKLEIAEKRKRQERNPPQSEADEYELALERRFVLKDESRFTTSEHWQCVKVINAMVSIATASDKILIYSKSLEELYYKNFLKDLEQGRQVRIILDDKKGTSVIKELPQEIQRRIDCRVRTSPTGFDIHFLLFGNAFRQEIEEHEGELHMYCFFNHPKRSLELYANFERMWEEAEPQQHDLLF